MKKGMTKKADKVCPKISSKNYATLQVKPTKPFAVNLRGDDLLGRTGEMRRAINICRTGGSRFPRSSWRHKCTAAEKLTWYAYFLVFSCLTTHVVINWEKLYVVSLEKISCIINSGFFEWRKERPIVYLRYRKEVSIPQRIAYSCFSSSGGKSRLVKSVS